MFTISLPIIMSIWKKGRNMKHYFTFLMLGVNTVLTRRII